ncbi:MAG: VOC family protein [Alphaproteobacteria bacterium]
MPRPIHFEIHSENPDRAAKFYSQMFGWNVQHIPQMDYWLISTGDEKTPGINGGFVRRRGSKPADGQAVNAFVCTIDVPNIDDFVAKAVKLGAAVALPKMAVPGVGWLAYIKDLDGNILGLMQNDKSAK